MLTKTSHPRRKASSHNPKTTKKHHNTSKSKSLHHRKPLPLPPTTSSSRRNFGTDGRIFSSHPPGHPEEGEVYKAITKKITTCEDIKNLYHFDLLNESDQHSGPRWRESHFKLTLVADLPANCRTLLSKHRFINNVLQEEIPQLHAMSLHLYTKPQWVEQFGETAPASPLCASHTPTKSDV